MEPQEVSICLVVFDVVVDKGYSMVSCVGEFHPESVPWAVCFYIGYNILNYLLRIIISPIVGPFPILMVVFAVSNVVRVCGIYYPCHISIITKRQPVGCLIGCYRRVVAVVYYESALPSTS